MNIENYLISKIFCGFERRGLKKVLLLLPWLENSLPVLPTGIGLPGSMTAICAPCL